MRLKMLLALMSASLMLWGVDLRWQRDQVDRDRARLEKQISRIEGDLRRIRSDVQQHLATPQLQLALDNLGFQRAYRDTRALARELIRVEEGSELAGTRSKGKPVW